MGPKLVFSHYLHSIVSQSDKPDTDTVLLDRAAVVDMLNPSVSRTFQEYACLPGICTTCDTSTGVIKKS